MIMKDGLLKILRLALTSSEILPLHDPPATRPQDFNGMDHYIHIPHKSPLLTCCQPTAGKSSTLTWLGCMCRSGAKHCQAAETLGIAVSATL